MRGGRGDSPAWDARARLSQRLRLPRWLREDRARRGRKERGVASLCSSSARRGEGGDDFGLDLSGIGRGRGGEGGDETRRFDGALRLSGRQHNGNFVTGFYLPVCHAQAHAAWMGSRGRLFVLVAFFLRACSAGYPSRADQRGSLDLAIWINHEF